MTDLTYADLGWSGFFAEQADAETARPMRISAVHRDMMEAIAPDGSHRLTTPGSTADFVPGDWVLSENGIVTQLLDRQTLLKRRSAGNDTAAQLIAANVQTLGIVTSCNADFNIARLERYLVLAAEAGCLPLIVLTKSDETDEADRYLAEAERLSPLVSAIAINATDPEEVKRLYPWCRSGETLALVGSSGVGKTTLRNTLTGQAAATQDIRTDDAKGRHTTTSRALVRTHAGGWLVDTPGMRALPLSDAGEGIGAVFADIEELAAVCRFSDCAHETEPGCAIREAIANGELDEARMNRWRKLLREDARHAESMAQARARDKGFGKMVRGVKARKKLQRGA